MVYCQRCGKQNEDGAQFCNKCGNSLAGPPRDYRKEREEQCDEECAARGKSAPVFWGIVVTIIGLLILIEVLKSIEELNLPGWFYDFNFWWLLGLVIAIAIIWAGFKMMLRQD